MGVELRLFGIFFGDKIFFDEVGDQEANNIPKFLEENRVETIRTRAF